MTKTRIYLVSLLLLTAFYGRAQTTVTGTSYFSLLENVDQKTSNGATISEGVITGMTLADDAESPFNLTSVTCRGFMLVSADDNVSQTCNLCHATDADGDTYGYLAEAIDNLNTKVTMLSGSGKFKNLSGSGTSKRVALTTKGHGLYEWEITVSM